MRTAMMRIGLRIITLGLLTLLAAPGLAFDESTAAPTKSTLITEGVQKLIELQEAGGTWPYEGRYRIDSNIPITYHVGGTSLVALSLLYGAKSDDQKAQTAFRDGLKFVLDNLDHPQMAPSRELKYDMRVLGQAYALLFLCHVQHRQAAGAQKDLVAEWIPRLVDSLVFEQMDDGGWNYQGRPVHSSFVTASVIQALLWAHARKQAMPDAVFTRARDALLASRFKDGGFFYFGTHKSAKNRQPQDRLPGSIGRSPMCETMLLLLGAGSTERIQQSLDAFHTHWNELEKRRQKPGTHEGTYLIAPYYFYYGHRYAAQAIELLPASSQATERSRLYELLVRTRDKDGTWNDREFPRSRNYGTAMVLLALLSEDISPPPRYHNYELPGE